MNQAYNISSVGRLAYPSQTIKCVFDSLFEAHPAAFMDDMGQGALMVAL